MAASDDIIITLRDGVQTIKLNRPHKKNSFTRSMYEKLAQTLRDNITNDDVLVSVLTGEGDYYSSGTDLTNHSAYENFPDPVLGIKRNLLSFVEAFIHYPKILVAIINGPAIGIAATTLALCDIVYASDKAFLQTPFTKLGMSPEGCSSYTFPKLFGTNKATDMLLFGYKMSSAEARDYGLVSEIYSSDAMLEGIWNKIYKMADYPKQSLLHTKKLMKTFDIDSLVLANVRECDELEERWKSEEFHTAIANFLMRTNSKL